MRLLIVEDEPFIAADLECIAVDFGHTVVGVADNKAAALYLARTQSPDAALLDLKLRDGFTGGEIAAELAQGLSLPFAFITGNIEQLPQGAYGAVAVVAKPFTDAGVRAAIEALGPAAQAAAT